MRSLVVLAAVVAAVLSEPFSYDGYKVYRIHPASEAQLKGLAQVTQSDDFDYWSPIRYKGNPIDVMVVPKSQDHLAWYLNNTGMKYEILIDNVETVIQKEGIMQRMAPSPRKGRISFTKYNRHAEINAYLHELQKDHHDIVSVETIGLSYEGRELKVIKISTNPNANKPVIFIDAGIHAREWAAPAQATYIINQLVENPENKHLLEKVDWHVLPVVNPDGYEYTHTNDRLWRKTRSKGEQCYGADANRNFDFHWGEVGVSVFDCSDIFLGREPFSESESRAIRDYVNESNGRIKLYLTFHSYGNYLLFPWGYTSALPDNNDELQGLGEAVAATIKKATGTKYTVGTSTNVLYPAAGGSDDWVKAIGGVSLAYTVELPGGGSNGFNPPPSEIIPIVTETWLGIKTYHSYIEKKYG